MDRSSLIRLASSLPEGSQERREILQRLTRPVVLAGIRHALDEELQQALEPETFFDKNLIHEEPHELEKFFLAVLPGDDRSQHPNLPEINPYLWVPYSELKRLLREGDLSAEDRRHVDNAISWQST